MSHKLSLYTNNSDHILQQTNIAGSKVVTVETVIVHTEVEEFKCELCVFKTTDKARFTKHQKEIHSLKGKYFCSNCERPFDNRKEFNGHKYHGCGT